MTCDRRAQARPVHPQWCIAQAPADQAELARYCRFNGGGDSGIWISNLMLFGSTGGSFEIQ